MKKSFFLFVCVFVCLSWAGSALAVMTTIDYAFTADNRAGTIDGVTGLSISGSDGFQANIISKTDSWQNYLAGSYTFDYNLGVTYTLQWLVQNDGGTPTSSNPMAFLGVFSVFNQQYISSASNPWTVNDSPATSLGLLSEDNVWNKVGNDNLVTYFSGLGVDPSWIGFTSGDLKSMTVTASFAAPVPIPGAALLLGSAMLGLVGLRRTRMV